jgi:hypothetical protein
LPVFNRISHLTQTPYFTLPHLVRCVHLRDAQALREINSSQQQRMVLSLHSEGATMKDSAPGVGAKQQGMLGSAGHAVVATRPAVNATVAGALDGALSHSVQAHGDTQPTATPSHGLGDTQPTATPSHGLGDTRPTATPSHGLGDTRPTATPSHGLGDQDGQAAIGDHAASEASALALPQVSAGCSHDVAGAAACDDNGDCSNGADATVGDAEGNGAAVAAAAEGAVGSQQESDSRQVAILVDDDTAIDPAVAPTIAPEEISTKFRNVSLAPSTLALSAQLASSPLAN